ncbi:hypothetical protein CEP51_004308 [Fusarium floridanum]|uniref:Uncharacterized protein n=1 Tax=Fusarium floridanum TaxID=1325733 RepID=A0A428S1S2_9HYPO|nr:hypothetical protein CEP51_004308 [Fusarium floridanum]
MFDNILGRDASNTAFMLSDDTAMTPDSLQPSTTSPYSEHIDLPTTFPNESSSFYIHRKPIAESIGEDRTPQSHTRRVNAPTRPFRNTIDEPNHDHGLKHMPPEPESMDTILLNDKTSWVKSFREDCYGGWELVDNKAWLMETPNSKTSLRSLLNTTPVTEDDNTPRVHQRVNSEEIHTSLLPSRLEPLCRAYGIRLIQFYINWRSTGNNMETKLLLIDLIIAAIEGRKKMNLEIEPFAPTPDFLDRRIDTIMLIPFDGFQDHPDNFMISHASILSSDLSTMTLRMVAIGIVKLHPWRLQEMFWAATDDEERLLQSASICGKMIGDEIGCNFLESVALIELVEGWLTLWNHMMDQTRSGLEMD